MTDAPDPTDPPLDLLTALPDTSDAPGAGLLHDIYLGPGMGYVSLTLEKAVMTPFDLWPGYAFDVREACGIRWNWCDIRRFLQKTKQVGKCLIWQGAKSRGTGNVQWYGSFYTQGKTVRAHKFYAVAVLGLRPGPEDELDHECNDTLCVHVRILSKAENRDRIRRPTKRILDLAKACDLSPAEVMRLPEDKIETYSRMLEIADRINKGEHIPGVIVCHRTGVAKRKKR